MKNYGWECKNVLVRVKVGSKRPYREFARIYDQVMSDVPYRAWFDYILNIWSIFGFWPTTVLDLACGTGNMSLLLAKRGFKVTALDASPSMLEVARKKAQAENLDIEFTCQDMRDFSLKFPVEAVISVFDSLNYLLEPDDLRSTFQRVFSALLPGGYFVFDVNTPHRLSSIPKTTTLLEGKNYFVVWRDHWDEKHRWWQVNLTGFIEYDGKWSRFDEIHRERAFPLQDLERWLSEAGFSVEAIFDSCTFKKATPTTCRAYFVARKPIDGAGK
ncbi:MAG TPA: methyltransferase domain-containing protein [Firmicutes bacterium]|nr:methyltransferase domain-containing protein [Candidatus Fermentithermobacillaceae bacterium]